MTTINKMERTVEAFENPPKKKPKAYEIFMDIKNGNKAQEIIKKHQISLQQLKMIIMHCYKKGMLTKADLAKNFINKPTTKNFNNCSTNRKDKTNQPRTYIKEDNAEENSIDIGNLINLIINKVRNEKIIGGLFALTAQNICALCLIIFFFFPWISFGGLITVSGYKLPAAIKSLGEMAQILETADSISPKVYFSYLLYLIPICGAATIFLNAKGKDSRAVGLVGASIPIIMLIYMFVEIGADTLNGIASGVYLTLLASAGLIFVTVYDTEKIKKKLANAAAASGNKAGISLGDKKAK